MFNEYPRPQMVRPEWTNLCSPWDYAITDTAARPQSWDGQILVPFSPEAPASGVERSPRPDQWLWYRKKTCLPNPRGRLLLHFGAVDQQAIVWCNGREVARHWGGFTPFSADLTEALGPEGEAEILIAVQDRTEQSPLARGKQNSRRGGIWYTPQSGIWQPVWAESVPERHIQRLRITPLYDEAAVLIEAFPGGTVRFAGRDYESPARVPVPDFMPWSPEAPHLYDFSVRLGDDEVLSYFAMRKIEVKEARILLNGQPLFMNGVLDQGYNPRGLLTYGSDAEMISDIKLARDMGFNTIRKHAKTEPLRWYYHCDRLGMLVWQDMPNGGGAYRFPVVNVPVVTGSFLNDRRHRLFDRSDAQGRRMYYRELQELMENLYNCPSIVMWVLFNEGWGQFDAAEALEFARGLDSSRILDHASGWHDQGVGELKDYHIYFRAYRHKPDKMGRAVVVSEYGGYNLRISGHAWNDKNFGYNHCADADALEAKLTKLFQTQIAAARDKGLAGAIYTQLTDVEDELNGLVTYDRQVMKLPLHKLRRIIKL